MKIKYKILFISVTVALFLLGSYYYYKYRQSTIEQMAKEAFVEAVNSEAYRRIPDVKLTVGFNGGDILRKDDVPEYIIGMMSQVRGSIRLIRRNIGRM